MAWQDRQQALRRRARKGALVLRHRWQAIRAATWVQRVRLIRAPGDTTPFFARQQLWIGRQLGRVYLRGERTIERGRIERSRLPERTSNQRLLFEILRGQKQLLFAVVALVVIGLVIDWALRKHGAPLRDILPFGETLEREVTLPSDGTLRAVLGATAAGLGVILGLVLSISLIAFQMTSSRYGSARIVEFLLREQVATYAVRLLALGFIYSLWVLALVGMLPNYTPYFSTLIAVVLASVSVIALMTYRVHALGGYLPGEMVRRLRAEVLREYERARKRWSGRSVQHHSGRVADGSLRTYEDVLRKLASDEEWPGVAAGVRGLGTMLNGYLLGKQDLDPQSQWFERREVPLAPDWSGITEHIARQGYMPPTNQEPDHEWFERRVLGLVQAVAELGALKAPEVATAIFTLLDEAIQYAWLAEDEPVIDLVMDLADEVAQRPEVIEHVELSQRAMQFHMAAIHSASIGFPTTAARIVAAKPWRGSAEHLDLPRASRLAAGELGEKVRLEIGVVGRVVTPTERMESELDIPWQETRSRVQHHAFDRSLEGAYQHLSSAYSAGNYEVALAAARLLVRLLLLSVDRSLSPSIDAAAFGRAVVDIYTRQFATSKQAADEFRRDYLLLMRSLAEIDEWELLWRLLRSAVLVASVGPPPDTDDQQRLRLGFDVLMTLAYIHGWAEFRERDDHVLQLSQFLFQPYRDFDEFYDSVKGQGHFSTALLGLGIDAYRWFQPLNSAVHELPDIHDQDGLGFSTHKDHPSELFRRWHLGSGHDEVLVHLVDMIHDARERERARLVERLRAISEVRRNV